MLRQYRLKDYNFRLIIWVIALSVVGILVIGSAKESVQTKQIAGLILGLVVMVITSLIDYSWVLGFYWLSYFVGIGLLAAVLLAGENVGGATRWIRVGGVLQFQPSDVVKILMIAFFAKFFSKHEEDISRFKNDPDRFASCGSSDSPAFEGTGSFHDHRICITFLCNVFCIRIEL